MKSKKKLPILFFLIKRKGGLKGAFIKRLFFQRALRGSRKNFKKKKKKIWGFLKIWKHKGKNFWPMNFFY